MKLKNLIKDVPIIKKLYTDLEQEINCLENDTRKKMQNGLFFCISGVEIDRHALIGDAYNNGAKVFVVERELDIVYPQIVVKNCRNAMSLIAKNFYNGCCDKMKIVGITGTNGKTTSAFMLAHILGLSGHRTAIIGTQGFYINKVLIDKNLTTPDPIDLHSYFFKAHQNGCEYVVMEVSAHAIALNKLDGICYDLAIITNITEDHLDFFSTMQEYAKTKLSFVNSPNVKSFVYNADDATLERNLYKAFTPHVSFGIDSPSDCFAVNIKSDISGSSFVANVLDNILNIKIKLAGTYNIENALGVITGAMLLGVPKQKIVDALKKFEGVEGRFAVKKVNNVYFVIDYAHTPDGMEKILSTLKNVKNEKLITVFGCGGNRDRLKRPIMAGIAEKYSDYVVVTSDNPRFEKPQDIIDEVCAGFKKNNFITEENRSEAIKKSYLMSSPDTIIALLGKGGEDYLDIMGKKISYSDYSEVEKLKFIDLSKN